MLGYGLQTRFLEDPWCELETLFLRFAMNGVSVKTGIHCPSMALRPQEVRQISGCADRRQRTLSPVFS
jgi:hypothetical protein